MITAAGKTAVLVIAETRSGEVTPLTLELLGLARELAGPLEGAVAAALVGADPQNADTLIAYGADRVYVCGNRDATQYGGDVWVPMLEELARKTSPSALLCGHTPVGADLAPRLAFRLRSAVAMGCIEVKCGSGKLFFTRPCYGGNVRETVSFTTSPAVATVKAGVGTPAADAARKGEIVQVAAEPLKGRARVIAREVETAGKRLEDAKIVIAGGRGLEGAEGFRVLETLADVLGGSVGSSRVPCDLGWCPPSWQIGLTGKTVTPDLYFAVGISGAGHHMAGCGNAKTIVAINTDPEAAIFREARFGLVGDYRKIVPALASAVAKLKQETQP
ncbi:MAG TPA: electron transfer flavoprotein subunit alpha/FixB family protein [Burkholderiales bacterium]|nr:electron transfer flavoprotein subunit alpha/FixB family protein [Burkholderiales bacterium]